MTAFANHFGFEFRTGIRNRSLLLLNYLFPLAFYLLMGFVMPGLNPMFLDVLIPAMVVFAILTATLLGLPDPLVTARDTGIFRSYKINGVPKASILIIPALTTALHTTIVCTFITFSAPLLFDAPLPVNWLGLCARLRRGTAGVLRTGRFDRRDLAQQPSDHLTIADDLLALHADRGLDVAHRSAAPRRPGRGHAAAAHLHHERIPRVGYEWPVEFGAWGSVAMLLAGAFTAFWLAFYLFQWDSQQQRRLPLATAVLAIVPYLAGMLALLFWPT